MTDHRSDDARLAETLAHRSTWVEPPAALEDRVVQAVLGAGSNALAPVTPIRPALVPQLRPRRRARRTRALLSIAAAVAATAIASGVLAARSEEHPDFKGRLVASATAPAAHGAAEMYKSDAGFRVELDARDLPRLTAAEYYQAWLRNSMGTAVPIGTFSANGGDITLWSGVSPDRFPVLSITIETADNDQHSSGRPVLVGTMRAPERD